MTTLKTIREVEIINGDETRLVKVLQDSRGFWLHEPVADPYCESLVQLADDSDTAIMDVIRDNGFEIVEPPTKPARVRVLYWVGTTQYEDLAADYAEAMKIAGRNRNAYPPTFYEIATGNRLFDDGNGLCVEDQSYYVV